MLILYNVSRKCGILKGTGSEICDSLWQRRGNICQK